MIAIIDNGAEIIEIDHEKCKAYSETINLKYVYCL